MRIHQIILILIKIAIFIQLALVFFKKQSKDSRVFIITDAIFNIYVGLFVMFFFLFAKKDIVIDIHDKLFIALAGFLLIYNIDYPKLLHALKGD